MCMRHCARTMHKVVAVHVHTAWQGADRDAAEHSDTDCARVFCAGGAHTQEMQGLDLTKCSAGAVARITQKILALAKHMRTNRKDFSARKCAAV